MHITMTFALIPLGVQGFLINFSNASMDVAVEKKKLSKLFLIPERNLTFGPLKGQSKGWKMALNHCRKVTQHLNSPRAQTNCVKAPRAD